MTTKRDLVRLAFEELNVPAYNGGALVSEAGEPSTHTVQDVIDLAYGEAGQSPLKDSPDPEEYEYAHRQLDTMLAAWKSAKRLNLGYDFNANLNDLCGLTDSVVRVASLSLAVRLSVLNGRQISDDTRQTAADDLAALLAYYNASPYRRLEAMMQEWYAAYGLDLGYTFTDPISGDDIATIPPGSEQVVALSLAMRIAPALGKQVSPETRKAQAEGFASLRVAYMRIPTMQLGRNTIAGAGNRYRWSPYFQPAVERPSVVDTGYPTYDEGVEVID